MIRPAAATLVALLLSQAPAPRYDGALLQCAVFGESVESRLVSRSGLSTIEARIGRSGVLVVTARDSGEVTRVTAWYDSLAVWRETESGREAPETDGFVGGRYEGILTTEGRYRRLRDPFVPAPLADLADLDGVLDEFLPRLAPASLQSGERWTDSVGFEIHRLADTRVDDRTLPRYGWSADRRAKERLAAGEDSLPLELEQRTRETGELTWSPGYGPLAWSRAITVDASVPARLAVKRSLASRLEQRVRVFQLFDHPACRASH